MFSFGLSLYRKNNLFPFTGTITVQFCVPFKIRPMTVLLDITSIEKQKTVDAYPVKRQLVEDSDKRH
jgi:hypothetical protein